MIRLLKTLLVFCFVVALCVPVLAVDSDLALTDGLIAYYTFDTGDTTPSYFLDEVSNSTTRALYKLAGATETAAGFIGEAAALDGTVGATGDRLNTTGSGLNFTGTSANLSISCWYSVDDNTTADGGALFMLADSSPTRTNVDGWLGVEFPSQSVTPSNAYFMQRDGTSTYDALTGDLGLYWGDAWTHNVFIYNSSDDYMYFYQNGVYKGRVSPGGTLETNPYKQFIIGVQVNNDDATLQGQADECAVYQKTLSTLEITSLYNAGAGCQYPFTVCTAGDLGSYAFYFVNTTDLFNNSPLVDSNVTFYNTSQYLGTNKTGTDGIAKWWINATIAPASILANISHYKNQTVLSNITIINVGTNDSNATNSTWFTDSVFTQIGEVGGTPGFDTELYFGRYAYPNGQLLATRGKALNIYGRYEGNPAHTVNVQIYNVTSAAYQTLGTMASSASNAWYNFTFSPSTDYISGGRAIVRIQHSSAGNPAHDLFIDYIEFIGDYEDYFNITVLTLPRNTTVKKNMSTGVYTNLSVFKIVTADAVDQPFNVSVAEGRNYTLSGAGEYIYLKLGLNNLTVSRPGVWPYSYGGVFNVTAKTNTTASLSGWYNSTINYTFKNAYTLANVSNFSTVTQSALIYGYSLNTSTTNGSIYVPWLGGLFFSVVGDSPGYALVSTNGTPNATIFNFALSSYTNNSILINIFSQDTGLVITANVTIMINGNSSSTVYNTVSGEQFITNLNDGNYTITFTAANYSLVSYSVTVATRSTQRLSAYLSSSTDTVIFTARNADTGATIEGATIGMYRLLNSTLTLVSTKNTDITGRAQLTYTPLIKYSFQFDAGGFTSKTFSLDPIIFSSYDVLLSPLITESTDYADVSVSYTPYKYYANATNNFTILFNSPNGVLTGYSVSIAYPGGTYTNSGVNANGGTFNTVFNISSAIVTFSDTVNVTYSYTTTFGHTETRVYRYGIIGVYGNTIISLEKNYYGLGLFERILISTVLAVIIAGLGTLFVGATFGAILGFFVMGFFAYLGFLPWVATTLAMAIGFMILGSRVGD